MTDKKKKEKMTLFEYAIIFNPATAEDEESKAEVIKTGQMLDKNQDIVAKKLLRKEVPEKYDEQLEDIDIIVRPF